MAETPRNEASSPEASELRELSGLGVRVMEQTELEQSVHRRAAQDMAEQELEVETKRLVRLDAALEKKRGQLDKANESLDRAKSTATVRYGNTLDRAARLEDEIAQLEADRAELGERIAGIEASDSTSSDQPAVDDVQVKQEAVDTQPSNLALMVVPRRRAAVAAEQRTSMATAASGDDDAESAHSPSTEHEHDSDTYEPASLARGGHVNRSAEDSDVSYHDDAHDTDDALESEATDGVSTARVLPAGEFDDGDEMAYQQRVFAWCISRWRNRHRNDSEDALQQSSTDLVDAGDGLQIPREQLLEEPFLDDPDAPDHTIAAYDRRKPSLHVPRQIWDRLLEYQRAGLRWMFTLHQQNAGGILGDEMGLGKTVQVVSHLGSLYHSRLLTHPSIVVCPATLMRQWVREFHTWWPVLRVTILHSTGYAMRLNVEEDASAELPYDLTTSLADGTDAEIWEAGKAANPQFGGDIDGSPELEYDSSDEYVYDAYGSRIRRKRKPRGSVDWRKRQKQLKNKRKKKGDPLSKMSRENLARAQRLVNHVQQNGHVIIVTYSGLQIYGDILLRHKWGYAVLDEGHMIRNPDADATLACKRLDTRHRILVTGTPIQNNLTELWSLFDFIFPGRLGTLPVFNNQFAVPITLGGYATANPLQVRAAYRCACILRDLIDPYLLRRLKADVAQDLPKKTEQVLFCRLTPIQRTAYREFLQSGDMQRILTGNLQMLFGVDVARKICDHPDLLLLSTLPGAAATHRIASGAAKTDVDGRHHTHSDIGSGDSEDEFTEGTRPAADRLPPDYGDWHKSGKMTIVRALLEMWKPQGHRVLIFSQTRQMLDIIERMLREMPAVEYRRMDGSTPIQHRTAMVDEYNSDSSIFVFLLTTKVGGLGINLTGADRVILFSPDWNPSSDMQARERAWRLGQSRNVAIYRLMTAGTIEEKIYNRQIYKQFLSSKILEDPKQKRFFHSQTLGDLFSLTEFDAGSDGNPAEVSITAPMDLGADMDDDSANVDAGSRSSRSAQVTETGRMFANAQIYPKADGDSNSADEGANGGSDTSPSAEAPRDDGIESIGGVVRLESFKAPADGDEHGGDEEASRVHRDEQQTERRDEQSEDDTDKDEDRVLRSLFKMSGMHSALEHDAIVGNKGDEAQAIDREAERIARDARTALRDSQRSRRQVGVCIPTWTGASGNAGVPDAAQYGSGQSRRVAPPPSAVLNGEMPDEAQFPGQRAVGASRRRPLPLGAAPTHGSLSASPQRSSSGVGGRAPSSANLLAGLRARVATESDSDSTSVAHRVNISMRPETASRGSRASSPAGSVAAQPHRHTRQTRLQPLPASFRSRIPARPPDAKNPSPHGTGQSGRGNVGGRAAYADEKDKAVVERIRRLLLLNDGQVSHRMLAEEFGNEFSPAEQPRLKDLAKRVADLVTLQPETKVNRTGIGRAVHKFWRLRRDASKT
ncbi:DNA repair protein rhp26 [Coemansia sp. RSA 552]|nr:DNA repair protein rhp26 [Coemansia sp. RSA 552]